jgi:hypothetical protein
MWFEEEAERAIKRFVLGVAVLLIVICVALGVLIGRASAHDWFDGLRNPVTNWLCCTDGYDCHVRAEEDIWRDGADYVIRDFDGKEYRIPADQAQPTQDKQGRPAACILFGKARCVFIRVDG